MLRGSKPTPFFASLESFLAQNCIGREAPSEVARGRDQESRAAFSPPHRAQEGWGDRLIGR
jgi:hypothetical protein